MKKIKNLKIRNMALLACLSAAVLTGCNNNMTYHGINLEYDDDNQLNGGNVSFDGLKELKVIKFIDHATGVDTTRLVMIEHIHTPVAEFFDGDHYNYIDVKSGVTIYSRITHRETENDLEIVDERAIKPYLLQNDDIKKEYTIDELIDLCDKVIIPDMENNKELTK